MEYVEWDDTKPVLPSPALDDVRPGAVPKGSTPYYRLTTDARFGNRTHSDREVSYSSG
jgi:hypothetical protein